MTKNTNKVTTKNAKNNTKTTKTEGAKTMTNAANMNNTTSNTQEATTNTFVSSGKLGWNVDTLLEASFMFPTPHFETMDDMLSATEEDFTNVVIALIESASPLSSSEQKAMFSAAHATQNKRLRIYHTAEAIAYQIYEFKKEADFREGDSELVVKDLGVNKIDG